MLASLGTVLTALSLWAMIDFCDLNVFMLVWLLVGPLAPLLLLVGFVLGVATVGKSRRRWQPIVAIVLGVVVGLVSLVTLLPAFTIATGGTLACNDEAHPNYTQPGR